MTEIAVNVTTPKVVERPYGFGSNHIDNLAFAANTSVAYQYIVAPADGKLKSVTVSGAVTSDATKTYTIVVNNMNNSDVNMIGTTLYDADPVLTAGTVAEAVLHATAANLVVEKGDIIRVGHTGGTGSGLAGVMLEWELA